MRWRFVLAFSIGASLLIHTWLPLGSELSQFLIAGLGLSLISRSTQVLWNSLAQRLKRSQPSYSQVAQNVSVGSLLHERTANQQRQIEMEPPLQH